MCPYTLLLHFFASSLLTNMMSEFPIISETNCFRHYFTGFEVFWGLLFKIQKGFTCIIQLHSRKFQDLAVFDLQFSTSESFHLYASGASLN
jgi:hypothetical protein